MNAATASSSRSASMQSMAEKLFQTMGRPEPISDPRYATNTDRVRNDLELDAIVADFMRERTCSKKTSRSSTLPA